jgi:hypothetical protein
MMSEMMCLFNIIEKEECGIEGRFGTLHQDIAR